MDETKWGVTHCLVCEKPYAQDEHYDEYSRLENEHRAAGGRGESQAMQKLGESVCWGENGCACDGGSGLPDYKKRILLALLRERDGLLQRLAELEQNDAAND